MTFPAALGFVTSTLPKVVVGVGSLVALVASLSVSFLTGLGSLIMAGALLWLRYHMEGKEKDKQRQHEASKWKYDAIQREKNRQHEASEADKNRKKEIKLALIAAQDRTSSSVMAVA